MSCANICQFSDDRVYRYTLTERWSDDPLVQFIGLNPSTADETQDDPTIRRCKNFARSWKCGGIVMTNLFAFRSTDPAGLLTATKPIGEDGCYITVGNHEFTSRNDFHLWVTAKRVKIVIACWGTQGGHLYRNVKVKQLIPMMFCLAKTKDGHPQHPLYLKASLTPIPFT